MKRKKLNIKVSLKPKDAAKHIIKLSEKTIEKKDKASVFLSEVANFFLFLSKTFKETFSRDFEVKEFLRQCFEIGYKTLPLISITGLIVGLVLTIQSRPVLIQFGAVSMLPSMVAISLIREMGPVIIALICAGKIGSGMGAELGSMKVTEQIDAMEVSGTNPFKYLVVTRVMAATLMLPVLVMLGDAVSLYGSWLGVNIRGNTSFDLFWTQVFDNLSFNDVLPAFIKSYFFGFAVGIIGCYKGYNSSKGTEGVGRSANSSVVVASVMIFVIDLLTVQVTDLLGIT